MIRFTLELAAALGYLAFAIASWLVAFVEMLLRFAVVVPILAARVLMAAIDVAIEKSIDRVFLRRRR